MQYRITLNDPWFGHVKNGRKVYEGRCYWKSAVNYRVGDFLRIGHHTDATAEEFTVVIEEILRFPTFEYALRQLDMDAVLPGIMTVEEGTEIYYKFVSLKTQQTHGICMIKVRKV